MKNKNLPINPAGFHDIGPGMTDEDHQNYVPDFQDVLRTENGAFVDYVYRFYGQENSIYGDEYLPPNGATKLEVLLAVKIRQLIASKKFPFDEDSADRELVRDILINAKTALDRKS
jgi:hypothetical protein|tara:strand:- start:573 stop:920 length:348 start_codon:yes stop_codon:yes gene_type:complete